MRIYHSIDSVTARGLANNIKIQNQGGMEEEAEKEEEG
jgi:hypothetical protein